MLLMEKVAMLNRKNETFALAMIIESKGSTPRHVGKMIVYRDGSIEGTVGGGLAEHYIIEESVKALEKGESKIVEYKLNRHAKDGIQMSCGGTLAIAHMRAMAKATLLACEPSRASDSPVAL